MARAWADREIRLCEECGKPIEAKRTNQLLCRACEEALERKKRKGQRLRQSRRSSRLEEESEDW
jgi:predicted amidophosphoribosyltransferase